MFIANASTNGDAQNGVNGNHHNHQIVLLANEKLESSDSEEQQQPQHLQRDEESKISNGANDEELTSLAWLHDKNLLKGKKVFALIY